MRGWAAGILEKDRELAVSGPYAFTRNPLYLGSFVVGIGGAVAGGRLWFGLFFVAFFAWMYGGTMTRENDALAQRFGDRYRHYRKSVPAFLPRRPRHRPTTEAARPPTSFSLARYARNREYEALLGAVVAFVLLALKAAAG